MTACRRWRITSVEASKYCNIRVRDTIKFIAMVGNDDGGFDGGQPTENVNLKKYLITKIFKFKLQGKKCLFHDTLFSLGREGNAGRCLYLQEIVKIIQREKNTTFYSRKKYFICSSSLLNRIYMEKKSGNK